MNCARARRWIPLYAEADLPARKSRRLKKHLKKCPGCREEIQEVKAALAGIRTVAGEEILEWPEAEWKSLMVSLRNQRPEKRRALRIELSPQKAWAYGISLVLALGIIAVIVKSVLAPPGLPISTELIAPTPIQPARSLVTGGAAFVTYPQDIPFRLQREKRLPDRAILAAASAPKKTTQDLMSITLVSQETGLKVHWTFNRNFEWKEEKK